MQQINLLLHAFLNHPLLIIIILFLLIKHKYIIEALSSYDKEQKRMIVSSRKVIAFMSANSLFHQINYCMIHSSMKDFNNTAGWTECAMTMVLLGLVTIPELGNFIQIVKNIIPTSKTETELNIKKTTTEQTQTI